MIETPQARPPGKKLETLEVVRAFAALAVVAFHSAYQSHLHGYSETVHPVLWMGKYGVQVFFVLSGFIIFYIHGKDLGDPDKCSRYFYRRWLRIWPLYAAITLIQVIGKPFLPGKEADFLNQIVTSLFFLDLENTPIVTVGWTLVHEAFFYITFGFLIVLGRRFAAWFGIVFTVCMLVKTFDESPANELVTFVFSHLKWYFLAGIAAACWLRSDQFERPHLVRIFSLSVFGVLGLLTLGLAMVPSVGVIAYRTPLLALGIGVTLLLLAKYDLMASVKMPRLLVYLGAASYSIYLVHSTLLDFGLIILGKVAPSLLWNHLGPTMLVMAIGAVIGGVLCHEILEKPLIKWVRSLKKS
jgi:peptidoglycan/LPS O-acetylase OafA/YrhL